MTLTETSPHHADVVGRLVHICVESPDPTVAREAERLAFGELRQLCSQFDQTDPESMVSRWIQHPGSVEPSAEFVEVLGRALDWQRRSGGAYNVRASRLGHLWRTAATAGTLPTEYQLAAAASAIDHAPYVFAGGQLLQTDDCHGLDVTDIAVAFASDRAADVAVHKVGVSSIRIDFDDHIVRRGTGHLDVALHDSTRQRLGGPPLTTVRLVDGTICCKSTHPPLRSIRARVNDAHIDPRNGRPSQRTASCVVIARHATTATALATVLTITDVDDGLALVERLNPVHTPSAAESRTSACLVLERNGTARCSRHWTSTQAVETREM